MRSELGRGGTGVVYLAFDGRKERPVAIKVLPSWLHHDPRRRARLQEEARLLAEVNHPAVATIRALERHGEVDFLVPEHAPGPTLGARLASGALSMDEVLHIGRGITHALEAAHARGVAHRDLKPENVILPPSGGVKVLDFGLARILPARAPRIAPARSTGQRSRQRRRPLPLVRGTPGFASPEQLQGHLGDTRSDLFSLGCILYECSTGRPTFGGATPVVRIEATRLSEPDWTALPADTPEAIRRILHGTLVRRPSRRIRDATAVRRLLEAEISRRSIFAAEPPWTDTPVSTNLPFALDSFIGRQVEQRDTLRLLENTHLVTLTGPGGSRKTRLALEVARARLARERRGQPSFPDGIWQVELASASHLEGALHAIAAVLQVRERRGVSLRKSVADALAEIRLLLLLDNCEHLPPAFAGVVPAWIASAPGLRILATSRRPLACAGEHVKRIGRLRIDEDARWSWASSVG